MKVRDTRQPWMTVGAVADYHPVIGGPATISARITYGPGCLNGHTWVLFLEGVRGCVACEACTLHGPERREVLP